VTIGINLGDLIESEIRWAQKDKYYMISLVLSHVESYKADLTEEDSRMEVSRVGVGTGGWGDAGERTHTKFQLERSKESVV
jgi:hypothetical protein